MNTVKHTLIAASIILASVVTAQASQDAFSEHRLITRGNGAADVSSVVYQQVEGVRASPARINRELRVASDRAAFLKVQTSSAAVSKGARAVQTASQKNRHS